MDKLLPAVEEIAVAAGKAILPYYRTDVEVQRKADESPLTAADLRADALIAERLNALAPEIPLISEERGIPDFAERRSWDRFWLVDPLDGTKEFLKRAGDFTVNIALIRNEKPVLGVIYAPALNLLYYAEDGVGAWRRIGGGPRERIFSSPASGEDGWTIVESRSHPSPELEAFLATRRIKSRIKIGSSLKFCRVAEGAADLYPRFGPTMEWDTAAGDCIYRCSGRGAPRSSPLTYNKPTLRNDAFVIGHDLQAASLT